VISFVRAVVATTVAEVTDCIGCLHAGGKISLPSLAAVHPHRISGAAHGPGEWRPFLGLTFPLLFAQTVAVGYRDLATLLLPSIVFTVLSASRGPAGAVEANRGMRATVQSQPRAVDEIT
jgi:hypothetical protein